MASLDTKNAEYMVSMGVQARLPTPYHYRMEEVDGVTMAYSSAAHPTESDRDGSTVAVHSPRNRNMAGTSLIQEVKRIKRAGGTETSGIHYGLQMMHGQTKLVNDAKAGQAAAPRVPDIDEGFVFLMDEDKDFYAAQYRMMAEPKVSWKENDDSGFYATPPLPYPMQFDANGKRPKETSCDSRWLHSSHVRQEGVFTFDM